MHLFLSPHYDDAVYSCGGTIYQLVQAGETARVYTVMGGSLPDQLPDTPIVRELHARWEAGNDPIQARRNEDIAAIYALDGEVAYNINISDCIYRVESLNNTPLYPTLEAIFGETHPDDPAIANLEFKVFNANTLWRELRFDEAGEHQFVPEHEVDVTLYAPLGIGNHVDHQITRDWAFKLKQAHPHLKLKFYEDFPYVQRPGELEKTLATFPRQIAKEPVYLTDAAVQAKIESVALYVTQLSSFWADKAALAEDVTRTLTLRGEGSPAEVYYTLLDD